MIKLIDVRNMHAYSFMHSFWHWLLCLFKYAYAGVFRIINLTGECLKISPVFEQMPVNVDSDQYPLISRGDCSYFNVEANGLSKMALAT